jgi:transcriptional regulator with XRE-family HTH domain
MPKRLAFVVDRRREVLKQFGRRLKAAREARHEKQQSLADALQLSRTTVSNLERGTQRVFLDQVYDCAIILGTDLNDLLPGVADVKSKPAVTTSPDDPLTRAAQDTAVAVIETIKNELGRADTTQSGAKIVKRRGTGRRRAKD